MKWGEEKDFNSLVLQQGQVIGFYMTEGTSTLQMNISGSEGEIETNIVSRAQLWV